MFYKNVALQFQVSSRFFIETTPPWRFLSA